MDPTCCMRRSQAVTHEHHVLHITYPCQKRKDATHSMRPALAITRRPVALHIRSACDNASTRRVAYQGPLILRVPVLGNDAYMCLSRRWVGITSLAALPRQGDLLPVPRPPMRLQQFLPEWGRNGT